MRRSYLGILIEPIAQIANDHKKIYATEFEKIFGQPLTIYWKWHGFDLYSFSEDFALKVPDRSVAEVVKERFGQPGHVLIEKLFALDERF